MAEPFQFELVSPERLLISEAVDEVVVPGAEGDFGVLKDHAPLMSTIRPGFLTVKHTDGQESKLFIVGGFADIGPGGLTVLAEKAIAAKDLKDEDIAAQIKDAEEDYADAADDETRLVAAAKLDNLKHMRDAVSQL